MADRHENSWQPVRPLEADQPDESIPRRASKVAEAQRNSGEVTRAPAGESATVAAAAGEEQATEREPFRSTPIMMPPEGVDYPPAASTSDDAVSNSGVPVDTATPPSARHVTAGTARAASAASEQKSRAAEQRDPGSQRRGSVASNAEWDGGDPGRPVDGSAESAESVQPAQRPKAGSTDRAPAVDRPVGHPLAQPHVHPVPGRNGWAPQSPWAPQNQGAAHSQWAPQHHAAPQESWRPHDLPASVNATRVHRDGAAESSWAAEVESPVDLGSALLIRSTRVSPVSGWRRALYKISGGRVNVGNSAAQQRRLELTAQVDRPFVGCYRVAVLSLKGGVGKTTTTATLGSIFAQVRGDRVIAIDANPDRGTLGQKVPCETAATVRNLLRDIDSLNRYSDVRAYTSQNVHRLEVLASDSDPAASEAFSGEDYERALELLERFYSIVLTDCGTGLMHSAMPSILEGADALVVVSSGSVDGARSASATLDWLDAHGYRDLVARSVAVVNAVRPRAGKVDLHKVVEHFEQRCARVQLIPFDPHLEEGAEIDLGRLRGATRTALLEVAAAVAAGFSTAPARSLHRRHR